MSSPRKRTTCFIAVGLLVCAGVSKAERAGEPLVSGERIPLGGGSDGPLSAGLLNTPLGIASGVFDSKAPGLFVSVGRFSTEPGVFFFPFLRRDEGGVPVFGKKIRLKINVDSSDKKGGPPVGTVFQTRNGTVYGYWLIKGKLQKTKLDPARAEFVALGKAMVVEGLPRAPHEVLAYENDDGSVSVLFSVSDGNAFRPKDGPGHRDPNYHPFNGRGIWTGGWPYLGLYASRLGSPEAETLEKAYAVTGDKEVRLAYCGLTSIQRREAGAHDIVAGSRFGNLLFYRNRSKGGIDLESQRMLRGPDGIALRHPTINASPTAYPDAAGAMTDLVVGGEGPLYYYHFLRMAEDGTPVYAEPKLVQEENAKLYTGSLPVLNAVDWDGDGVEDIIAGNSQGEIWFFRNEGTNAAPAFLPGVPLEAGGRKIHVQQGYWGIQGPGEARWGYSSPTLADWNEDGLPDVLLSDATARYTWLRNVGTRTEPKLEPAVPLYWEGIDLYGMWRVKPGVAKMGSRMAYVILDEDDEFRLYWKIDDRNVRDGGKLKLEDGSTIRANFLDAGGTGRAKIVLADWDKDGAVDMLVGTPRHGSVPNPTTGLPQSKGLPGAAVLWLRNTGSNEKPVFAFPKILHFRGNPVYFGQHECSVAVTELGPPGAPHLLVGDEEGRVHFFERGDISWEK